MRGRRWRVPRLPEPEGKPNGRFSPGSLDKVENGLHFAHRRLDNGANGRAVTHTLHSREEKPGMFDLKGLELAGKPQGGSKTKRCPGSLSDRCQQRSLIAHHGIEHDQKFTHASDEDDLVGFAFLFQTRGEFKDDGIVVIGHQSRHIESTADRSATAFDICDAQFLAPLPI